jgi:hypothetical protein
LTTSTGGVTDQVEVDESEGGRYRLRLPPALAAGTYQVLVTAVVESGDKVQRRRRQASLVVTPRQPGEVCDERSAIRVDPADVAAARNLEVKVVATLRDCDGKPLRVEPDRISFWTSAGRFAGEGPRQTGEGVFTQILNVPGTPGRVTVRPVVGVQKLDTMATLDVGAGPVDPVRTRLHLAVSPGYVKADGDMEAAVHVEPVDQFGNPLTGDVDVEIEFHEPVTAEWLSPVRPYSDSGYERIFTGGTETGEALVIGKVNGVPSRWWSTSSPTMTTWPTWMMTTAPACWTTVRSRPMPIRPTATPMASAMPASRNFRQANPARPVTVTANPAICGFGCA